MLSSLRDTNAQTEMAFRISQLCAFFVILGLCSCASVAPEIEARQYGSSSGSGTTGTGTGGSTGTGTGMTPQYNTTADISVLQYALTLENLEMNFYVQALQNYTQAQFVAAGLSAQDYNIITMVRDHEVTHVNTLKSAITALGASPVPACTYQFPVTDPKSFLPIARALENTGVSAYDGQVTLISNPAYLTVAASIVTVEARHASFFNFLSGKSPASIPFDIPLDQRQVVTIASPFIVLCPYTLPMTFPALTVSPAAGPVGTVLTLTSTANVSGNCAFITSSGAIMAPISGGKCTVPAGAAGDIYVVVTSATTPTGVNDASTVAGPATYSVGTVGDSSLGR